MRLFYYLLCGYNVLYILFVVLYAEGKIYYPVKINGYYLGSYLFAHTLICILTMIRSYSLFDGSIFAKVFIAIGGLSIGLNTLVTIVMIMLHAF